MALKAFLSNPTQEIRHRRHSSVLSQTPRSPQGSVSSGHARQSSMKRLSLGLSRTNDDTFSPFMTDEPEDLSTEPEPTQPERKSTSHETGDTPSEPTMSRGISQAHREQENLSSITEDHLPLPLPNPKRFSILGFRHASDPQLSTRFRNEESTAPSNNNPARKLLRCAK